MGYQTTNPRCEIFRIGDQEVFNFEAAVSTFDKSSLVGYLTERKNRHYKRGIRWLMVREGSNICDNKAHSVLRLHYLEAATARRLESACWFASGCRVTAVVFLLEQVQQAAAKLFLWWAA